MFEDFNYHFEQLNKCSEVLDDTLKLISLQLLILWY